MMKRNLGLIMMCILLAVMPAGCSASGGGVGTDSGEDTASAGSTRSAEIEGSAAQEGADGEYNEEEFSKKKRQELYYFGKES